jgi:tetratricopeptide (TPR) repeat protein
VLGIYLVLDNLLPFVLSGGAGGGGVAHGAHIGGFVAGLAAAWAMDRREVAGQPAAFRRAGVDSDATVARHLTDGDMPGAARAYFALQPGDTRRVLSPDDGMQLGGWLAANGFGDAALVVFRRLLRDYPADPVAARAHVAAGLVQLNQLRQVAPAYQHFLEALDLDPDPDTAGQARAALAQIAAMQKYQLGAGK